jgi:hypothetical protein
MSFTKRWIEDLMERGEYPHPQEVQVTIDEPPFVGHCPCCSQHFECGTPIPSGAICPTCYNESEQQIQQEQR